MRRQVLGMAVLPLLLVGAGCRSGAAEEVPTGPSPATAPTSTVTSGSTPSGSAPGDGGPVKDDLATGRVRHVIRSSGVTATVDYETRKPASAWTASGEKPLRVEVGVSRPTKKVYLNRVTLRFLVDDGNGNSPGPDQLVDATANIVPGYLVTQPYSYVQAFAIPAVDPSTVRMTMDVKLEFVSLVDAKAKDYTKQTITDRITTDIRR